MIEKILKEINRLKKELDGYSALEALDYIESYINTLPEEPVSQDLDEEIGKYTTNELLKKRNHSTGIYHLTQKDCDDIARHFAEWQKKQMMKDAVDGVVHHFADDELAAVHYNDPKGTPMSIYVSSKGLSAGEKVKIIIAKTEQQ